VEEHQKTPKAEEGKQEPKTLEAEGKQEPKKLTLAKSMQKILYI